MRKVLLVASAAEFSTFDVWRGIQKALHCANVPSEDYLLFQRFKLISGALANWAPEGQMPDLDLCCLHASEAIPYRAITTGCDWALIVSGMGVHPNAVWALRRIGVKIAIWFTEAPYDTSDDRELHLAQLADVAFINERTAIPSFQVALDKAGKGGMAVYLAHAYEPEWHRPGEGDAEHTCDVLLIGTGFRERQWLLEAIDWTGIDLRLGGLWPGISPPSDLAAHLVYPCLSNADTVQLYHGAKIALNPHRWAEGAESANPRVYELAACGTFQIADDRPEIGDIFDGSVPTYAPSVPWQLSALIRRYLADEPARRAQAERARELVQAHTFAARAQTILTTIAEWEREHAGPRVLVGGRA